MERRAAFFAELRAARQAKGIALEDIAASTKINISLLKALENNDLSRWPRGLFGRSYLRDYLRAVGLPVECTVAEFIRLFPDIDDLDGPELVPSEPPRPPASLALTFADGRRDRFEEMRRRLLAAAIDAVIVVAASAAVAWTFSSSFSTPAAAFALIYYSLGVAVLGHSLGAHWLVHRGWKRWRKTAAPAAANRLGERIRRLREFSPARGLAAIRDLARVPLHALLLRIKLPR